jgi:ligand-binding sensor domain-containing protein/serine phosphatase RsbU (regulator of sigma subunit)
LLQKFAIKYLTIVGLIFCLKIGILASYTQPKCYTAANGLSHNNINCILLEDRGFLWIGTKYGLNRYDGYRFVNIRNIKGDTNSLSDNNITALAADSSSDLWIGTSMGLNHYNIKTMNFNAYYFNPQDSNSISGNCINDLYIDGNNTVWILAGNVLNSFDIKKNRVHRYHIPGNSGKSDELELYTLEEGHNNMIWIGSSNGLYCFDKSSNKFIEIEYSIPEYPVKSILMDDAGNLWLGTDRGLLRIIKSKGIIKKYYNDLDTDNPEIINSINCLSYWNANSLMLGTELGLHMFSINEERYKPVNDPFSATKKLTYYPVRCIHNDFTELLWIGTSYGLFKINKNPPVFNNYSIDKLNGLKGKNITSIYMDNDGKLWLGTQNYGLNIINKKSGEIINYSKYNFNRERRIRSNKVPVIFEDSEGKIYLGTGKGVMLYIRKNENFESLSERLTSCNCDTFMNSVVYDILEDTFKTLWFATSSGLYSLKTGRQKCLHHHKLGEEEKKGILNPVFVLETADNNHLWIGTGNGLILLNTKTGNLKKYTSDSANQELRLISNSVFSLYNDLDNILWVGTEGGLTMIVQPSLTSKNYNAGIGLSRRFIYAIVEDNGNNLWLATDKGIIKFNKNDESFRLYDEPEGLLISEFIERSYLKTAYGEIFLGGIQGFCSFYPDSLIMNFHFPRVEITKMKYINRNLTYSIYKENFDSVMLPKCNYFTIEFSALDFVAPFKNQYMYTLHKIGGKPDWIKCGSMNYASFSDITPGTYIFQVRGANSDLVWNNEGKSMKIIIEASVWRSRKAIIIYTIAAILFIIILVIYRKIRIKRINYINQEKETIAKQILEQKEELIAKNNNIMDSIKYAKRIQSALMPAETSFKSIFPDSFILHIPKDIVSGDFYWFSKIGDKAFIAAVDCTGHGVPGAFMSIIGIEMFRNITNIEGIKQPAQILMTLNRDFQKIFHDKDIISFRDGMDLAFCAFDNKKMILEYAGAFNPIYIIREKNIYEYRGDRFSVGLDKPDENEKNIFKNHVIPMQDGDSIYIFSDGYADQFGGPDGKKYKYRKFQHLLLAINQLPMEKQHELLEKSIMRWKGDLDQVDDILVIGIKIHS